MKQGISLFSFSETTDVRWMFEHAQKAGYDGVEPVMSESGYLNPSTSQKEILAMRRMAEDLGLEIPSVGVWSLWENNLVSDQESIRNKAFSIVQKQIEAAHLLGADTILVVPGYVGCSFASKPEKIRYDIAYERSQDALSRLSRDAQQAGVAIGIENVWNRFLLSPLEIRRFLDEIGSDCVGMYLDVGNVIYTGYPEQWIELLAGRIKKLHMSDYRFDQAGIGAFVDLFAGDVDFPAVAEAIAKIGYDDYITLEMLPNYKQFPEVSLYADKYAMDKIAELVTQAKASF
ncbi:MAG: sugar phosphate isomerase/epimerase family protein [Intestinimonas sp.]|uniref:sugar phosphate isomerase/epimerase family protein n=1 Tax=Intestinimonas sp. TaxID=1965293 RepID=UPI002A91DDED|nr:sugar phosphate isomerase/epimerase family protein [Intestinimonas sp.]MDY5340417.1 sugar phosphate isomerase/epimerase family protein [Intestinimonas sp.]